MHPRRGAELAVLLNDLAGNCPITNSGRVINLQTRLIKSAALDYQRKDPAKNLILTYIWHSGSFAVEEKHNLQID
jgi:hypothetical protein